MTICWRRIVKSFAEAQVLHMCLLHNQRGSPISILKQLQPILVRLQEACMISCWQQICVGMCMLYCRVLCYRVSKDGCDDGLVLFVCHEHAVSKTLGLIMPW